MSRLGASVEPFDDSDLEMDSEAHPGLDAAPDAAQAGGAAVPVLDSQDALVARYGAAAVTAALRPMLSASRARRIEEILAARLGGLTVVLENLHDPHNGAACLRSIEALGVQSMHVVESLEHFSPSSGVTRGCQKWITLRRHPSFAECAAELRARGFVLYAAVPDASHDLDTIDVSRPCAIVFGNEREGLAAESIAACDASVAIRMYGFTESFNLSVSVALGVQALAARRRAALGHPGDLTEAERDHLRARWYARSVRGAAGVLARLIPAGPATAASPRGRGPAGGAAGAGRAEAASGAGVSQATHPGVDSVTRSVQDQAALEDGDG